MTLVINKNASKKEITAFLEKFLKKATPKTLRKHFGTAVKQVDDVAFQKKVRDEWG